MNKDITLEELTPLWKSLQNDDDMDITFDDEIYAHFKW